MNQLFFQALRGFSTARYCHNVTCHKGWSVSNSENTNGNVRISPQNATTTTYTNLKQISFFKA